MLYNRGMKNIVYIVSAFIMYKLVTFLFMHVYPTVGYDTTMQLFAPVWEEVLKACGNVYTTVYYSLIETVEYTIRYGIHVIIPRLLITLPMHIFAYKIGRKHGLIFAIMYHVMYNNICYNQPIVVCGVYAWVIGIIAICKR